IATFEKERPLLRIVEREAAVRADVRHIGLDLREVRIQRRIERERGRWTPLQIAAAVAAQRLGLDARGEIAALDTLRARVRSERHVAAGRQSADPSEFLFMTDE